MDSADKIFAICMVLVLIAVLINEHRRGAYPRVTSRLDGSTTPGGGNTGPAYLVSNLPNHRVQDSADPPVSY